MSTFAEAMRAGALLALVGAACAGCISLPSRTPAPTLFALDLAPAPVASPSVLGGQVVSVDAPAGQAAGLGDDLVWRENDTIAFIAGVGWSGAARGALQRMVAESARRAGAGAVFASGEGGRADLLLRWEVLSFQVVDGPDGPVAVFESAAQLLDARRRSLVAVLRVEEREHLTDRAQTNAAQALRAVAQRGAGRLGGWIASQAAAPPSPAPALVNTAGR
jgi:ABC-type uncharacterized transport system auxiliary subunit